MQEGADRVSFSDRGSKHDHKCTLGSTCTGSGGVCSLGTWALQKEKSCELPISHLEETVPRTAKLSFLFWGKHSTMLYDPALTKGRRQHPPGKGWALLRAHGA